VGKSKNEPTAPPARLFPQPPPPELTLYEIMAPTFLRDHFAGQIISGLIQSDLDPEACAFSADKAAEFAYKVADAMMKARVR
jgi:hypothetical protein